MSLDMAYSPVNRGFLPFSISCFPYHIGLPYEIVDDKVGLVSWVYVPKYILAHDLKAISWNPCQQKIQ